MICPNCKKQIPDDAVRCSYCDYDINHKEQVPIEIGHRRKQRWIFYVVIVVLFAVAIIALVTTMNKNSKLILDIANIQGDLDKTQSDVADKEAKLKQAKLDLAAKVAQLQKIGDDLSVKVTDLKDKTDKFKELFEEKNVIDEQYKECSVDLDSSEANIYNLIVKLGVGMSDKDLAKIPLADDNLDSIDTDGDGLSDIVEDLIATNPLLADSDHDGYSDKEEVLKGFNPMGEGSLGIDQAFADRQKGKILLQIEQGGEAWYVSPADGKRYFLGRPLDGFKIMRNLDYWNKLK